MNRKSFGVIRTILSILLCCTSLLALCACGTNSAPSTPTPKADNVETPAVKTVIKEQETPLPPEEPAETEEPFDGLRLTDDDGDGLIHFTFNYKGSTVYTLITLDPSRVFVGTAIQDPEVYYGFGKTLDELLTDYDAVGGINAGGFIDLNGAGSGWPPSGITYSDGVCYNREEIGTFGGIDTDNRLWAGYYSPEDCDGIGIRDGVSFGPVLIMDGVRTDPEKYDRGLGGRTAIGQREDGAIVMIVADGRQAYSIGLAFADLADILCDKFGCVNAVNMDGGNSSCIAYDGEIQNNSANLNIGTRTLPTAWLISSLPKNYSKPDSVPDELRFENGTFDVDMSSAPRCGGELADRLDEFGKQFIEFYYGYFGTGNADYYYPELKRFVADESELLDRMDQALLDREYVHSYRNEYSNIRLLGAYDNGDGTYTLEYTLDITEVSNYWIYDHADSYLRFTVYEDPESYYGFLAVSTD